MFNAWSIGEYFWQARAIQSLRKYSFKHAHGLPGESTCENAMCQDSAVRQKIEAATEKLLHWS